jgi:hypothetical protein
MREYNRKWDSTGLCTSKPTGISDQDREGTCSMADYLLSSRRSQMCATACNSTFLYTKLHIQAEAGGFRHASPFSRKASAMQAHHRLAVWSMFALFACAYVTLDRLPGSAVSVLRGGIGSVARSEIGQLTNPTF